MTVSRTPLPRNLFVSEGTLLEDFETTEDWFLGRASLSQSTINKQCGNSALIVDATAGGSGYRAITKAVNFDLTNTKVLGFWLYVESKYTFNSVNVRLSNNVADADANNDWTSYFTRTLDTSVNIHQGWNYIKIHKNDFTNTGAATWGVIRALRFVINPYTYIKDEYGVNTADLVVNTVIGFNGLWADPKGIAKIILCFDDSPKSLMTTAYPLMASHGIRGNIFVCTDHVSPPALEQWYMDYADHNTLYDAGWDFGNHGKTHTNYYTLTEAQIIDEIQTCRDWLLANGFTRAAYFCSAPENANYALARQVATDLGYTSFRSGKNREIDRLSDDEKMDWQTQEIKLTTTIAQLKAMVDRAIDLGSVMPIFTHGIFESPTDAYTTSIAIYTAFINYIVERGMAKHCITLSEWFEMLENPRKQVGRT